jgi:hypothetical protein
MARTPRLPEERQFIGIPQLRRRWNNCSQTLIEKRIRTDPDFPPIYNMFRHRMVAIDEVETYERKKVVETKAVKAASGR